MNGNGKVTFGAYKAGEGCSGSGICQAGDQAAGSAVSKPMWQKKMEKMIFFWRKDV